MRTSWSYPAATIVVLAAVAAGPASGAEPGPAAADGMPVPALLGGIVLAFAVGLSAGHVTRRRRAARRSAEAQERPAPAPDPVTREPRPIELATSAAPPAPPPPIPIRSHGPRIVRVRAEPDELEEVDVEPANDRIEEGPEGGALGAAPELPQPDAPPPATDVRATPLAQAPESVRRLRSEPDVAARRFGRARPWPKEAETLWTCEIAWKAGYLKSTFRAMAGPPGASRRRSIARSPSLRWTLMTDPDPPTPALVASVKVLVAALVAGGWEHSGRGAAWYAQRFVWRGGGEPGPVAVPDEIESAQ